MDYDMLYMCYILIDGMINVGGYCIYNILVTILDMNTASRLQSLATLATNVPIPTIIVLKKTALPYTRPHQNRRSRPERWLTKLKETALSLTKN